MKLAGELIPQYQLMALAQPKRYTQGSTVRRYLNDIAELVKEIPTESILDYGCGSGEQYTIQEMHKTWGIMPTLFDPARSKIDELPEKTFDGVICTGVLEHIPEAEIDVAIGNLVRYARKWAFIVVGTGPSRHKRLPNGGNVHVTIRPAEWWEEKVRSAFDPRVRVWLGFVPS